ncbi:unnamed protein product [Prorocentrum cordatum]|uniref:Uncharacterized protein n=1 Tax=Prorocentrum cordatum TaxID=2364126 RepID=A0ABN9Y7A3_9DINO|nr:unnamed protein product [Polarella glacialis]
MHRVVPPRARARRFHKLLSNTSRTSWHKGTLSWPPGRSGCAPNASATDNGSAKRLARSSSSWRLHLASPGPSPDRWSSTSWASLASSGSASGAKAWAPALMRTPRLLAREAAPPPAPPRTRAGGGRRLLRRRRLRPAREGAVPAALGAPRAAAPAAEHAGGGGGGDAGGGGGGGGGDGRAMGGRL